jgi:hypothetical protein
VSKPEHPVFSVGITAVTRMARSRESSFVTIRRSIISVLTLALTVVITSAVPAMAASGVRAPAAVSAPAMKTAMATASVTSTNCPFESICAYDAPTFVGTGSDRVVATNCGTDYFVPFLGTGSWDNNQTSGTRAFFKDSNHNVLLTTGGAHDQMDKFVWNDIVYIDPC